MTSIAGRVWIWISGLVLLALIWVTASSWLLPAAEITSQNATGAESTPQNAAAILTVVAAGAVGIERLIEIFWRIVGSTRLGSWWPLKPIGTRLDTFMDRLNDPLFNFYKQADEVTNATVEASEKVQLGLANAQNYFDEFVENIALLKQLEPGSSNARVFAARASRAVVGLKKLHPKKLKSSASTANKALAGVNEFVQTFEDNPARRLMSLYVGAILGLIFAALFSLDAFEAALGQAPFESAVYCGTPNNPDDDNCFARSVYNVLPNLGIAATGLVMGLGASPTHELIKALKETKERRKAEAQRNP